MSTPSPVITFGYEHLEPGHPDNPKPYRICGVPTRNPESKYPICTQPAGKRTTHPGVGRCFLHGGANLSGPDHPGWKGGRYAHIYKGRLKQHFEQLQADTSDPLDLLPELEVQRLLLAMAIEDLQGATDGSTLAIPLAKGTQKHDLRQSGTTDEGETDNLPCIDEGDDGESNIERESTTTTTRPPPPPLPQSSSPPSAHHPPGEFLISTEKLALVTDLANNVVKTVTQIIVARNQTALTMAEVKFLRSKMLEAIERFIPDVETRTAFIKWLIEEVPGGDAAERLETGEGSDPV